jgi:hypothetical protein
MRLTKSFTSLLLGAATLAALTTGCVREPLNVNPTYDPDSNSVVTKFVLNINPKSGDGTKMTAEDTQAGGNNFLGMQDVHILTYNLGAGNTPSFDGAPYVPSTPDNIYGKFYFNPAQAGKATEDYNFGRLLDANDVTSTSQSRVMELSFPLETNAVMLYGKALNTKGPDYQGSITATGDPANLASLKFALTPRVNPDNKLPYTAGTYALMGVLNSLTIAGLVDETAYWTTDGKEKSNDNNYQATGIANKQYKIWLPYEPNDLLYQKISGMSSGGEGIYEDPSGQDYTQGQEYQRRGDDPTSTYTYKLRIGNCAWKMLGEMYYAKIDGDPNTTPESVRNTCDPYTGTDGEGHILQFVPLLETLGEAYYKLLTISQITTWKDPSNHDLGQITYHELRAGSAAGILRTLRDLDFILHKVLDAKPTTWGEVIAQKLAEEIHTRMALYTTGEKDDMYFANAATIRTALYNNVKDVQSALDAYNASGIATYLSNAYFQGTGDKLDGTQGFPMNIGFPMGAAYIDAELKAQLLPALPDGRYLFHADRFIYKEDIPAYAFGNDDATFNIFNYCYPAELMYYGNSPLRISKEAHTTQDFPQTVAKWRDENPSTTMWGSDWTKFGAVTSETRSVAMVDHINYGSALLKSHVVYGDDVKTSGKLLDNNSLIHPSEQDNEITVIGPEINTGLTVTGIVVGGQPEAVTWDYTRMPKCTQTLPVSGLPTVDYSNVTYNTTTQKYVGLEFDDDFGKMIYDRVALTDRFRIKDADNTSATESNVYTLCWDNYNALENAAGQADVYIALELQNKTGQDFWGETNLVRKDAIFYLVGKLNLQNLIATHAASYEALNGTLGERSKTGFYYYPPFDPQTGATVEVPRVFMQDYMTTATLILHEDALKHAYMSVPDLRSNQVSLGVSVDIQWETGLSFEVEMGKIN